MITGYSNTVSVTTLESPFQFTVDTSQSGVSGSTEFTMPLTTSTGLDMYVDWGDGSAVENITDHTLATHDYGTAGTYTISVLGSILGWRFNNGGDKLKMGEIQKWGVLNISTDRGFYGCTNMTCTATDAPTITTTNLGVYFHSCTNFDGAIGNWDLSNVTSIFQILMGASSFNQDIGSWDVSNISNFNLLFLNASLFNNGGSSSINNWNTSNATNMQRMFQNTSFNQDIGNWDVSSVTDMAFVFFNTPFNQNISGWDTSNVTTMYRMFKEATSFNQDIGNWNVSSVTSMVEMFENADAFDQDISDWDINQVTNFVQFMTNATGLSTTNYDALLVGWEAQAPTYSGTIDFGGSQYSAAGYAARQSLISNYGWTITDGGSTMDADYKAILDYATTQGYTLPSASQQVLQNQLVGDLKDAGVWSKLDTFSVFATDGDSDFALIDWIGLTQYTAFNSPTHTTNKGWSTDGSSSYINTNYNFLTDSNYYTQNDAGIFIAFSEMDTSSYSGDAFCGTLTTSRFTTIRVDQNSLSSANRLWVNQSAQSDSMFNSKGDNHIYFGNRTSSSDINSRTTQLSTSTTNTQTATQTSVSLTSDTLALLRWSSGFMNSLHKMSFFGLSSNLSSTEMNDVCTAYDNYYSNL